jgi:hypothetical protein
VAIPPESDRILPYVNMGVINGAAVNVSRPFAVNSNSPAGSGGNTPAEFVQYAAMYDMYRPIACEMQLILTNNESFAVSVAYAFTDENPGSSASYDELAAERIVGNALLAGNGGQNRVTFKRFVKYSDLAGSDSVETDDTYRAIINAVPADTFWLTIGAFSPSLANLTLGIAFQLRLRMHIRFYNADLTSQQAPPSVQQRMLDEIVSRREQRRRALEEYAAAKSEEAKSSAMKKFLFHV